MSNNYIYSGVTTPLWNLIDYIHFGPRFHTAFDENGIRIDKSEEGLNGLDPANDNILIGRYVLVKYTTSIFSQDLKYQLMNYKEGEVYDPDNANTFTNAPLWRKCYAQDGSGEDYDGVVFQKVFKDNDLQYIPVALLSTSVSQEGFNTLFLTNQLAEANYLKKEAAEGIYLKLNDQLVENIRYFLEYETEKTEGVVDTLVEILNLINDTADGNTQVGTLIKQVSTNTSNIDTLTTQVNNNTTAIENISKQIYIPIETIEEFKDIKEWPDVDSDKLLVNLLYSKKGIVNIDKNWQAEEVNSKFLWDIDKIVDIDNITMFNGSETSDLYGEYVYDDQSNGFVWRNFYTSYDNTYPIAFYTINKGEWFGLLYLKYNNEQYSLHFTITTTPTNDFWSVYQMDSYDLTEGEDSGETLPLCHYTEFNKSISISEIIKLVLDVDEVDVYLADIANVNYFYLKKGFQLSSPDTYNIQELRYIKENNRTKAWVSVGYVTDLPQWQTF